VSDTTAADEGTVKRFPMFGLLALCKTATDTTCNTSGETRLNLATKTYDPASLVTVGVSWVFTAPRPGLYQFVPFELGFTANGSNWAAGDILKAYLYKNSSTYLGTLTQREFDAAVTSGVMSDVMLPSIPLTVSLAAAETAYMSVINAASAARVLYAGAALAIYQVA
jgi:hypothetical protein